MVAKFSELTPEKVARLQDVLKQGMLNRQESEILEILYGTDTTRHYSLSVHLMDLVDTSSDTEWGSGVWWPLLSKSPHKVLPLMDAALQEAQKELIRQRDRTTNNERWHGNAQENMFFKPKCSVRVNGIPALESKRTTIPTSIDAGSFLSITATVIRTGKVKMVESSKEVFCPTCKKTFEASADVEQYNQIVTPTKCLSEGNDRPCPGTKFQILDTPPGQLPKACRDYQEIKIQEQTTKLAMGTIPRSMFVILHDDLVDYAKSGDDVTITGTVIRRWKPPMPGDRCEIELAILANHVFIYNEQRVGVGVTEEQRVMFEQFWLKYRPPVPHDEPAKPFTARNIILSQICPQVYGLYIVKLAVMLVLAGGVQKVDKSGLKVRGEPHLLLVGDPGTGKSQFLKFATQLNPRSILTTGIGSSSAGLTVTAVKDGNEWLLEAGALVLADRGLCCIDEFGGMREHDKTAIHEAMEQQSISIAKAGIVCKLNTRCSVIAATNPKGKYDPEQSVSINIALASPLLSRFDLVLVLMDTGNPNWDRKISSFILKSKMMAADQDDPHRAVSRSQRSKRKRQMLNRTRTPSGREGDGGDRTDGRRRGMNDDASPEMTDETDSEIEDDVGQDPEGPWSIRKLKAYLIWVKATFEPRLTPPAEEVLIKYYQLQRKADVRNAARTTIRLLESLIRLSQAHARLMAKDLVTVEDAVAIVSLMEATAQGGVAVLGGVNPLHASFPKSAEDEYQIQETVLLRRLRLEHLASTPRVRQRQERRTEVDEEWQDVKEEVLSPVGAGSGRLVDLDQFRMLGSKRRRSSQPETSSANGSRDTKPETKNATLDDDEEEELLQRFRRDDILSTNIEEDCTYEEPLIDRRVNRRYARFPGWKGKEVDRGPGHVEQPTSGSSRIVEDDDDDDDLYGFRPPGSGSVEI